MCSRAWSNPMANLKNFIGKVATFFKKLQKLIGYKGILLLVGTSVSIQVVNIWYIGSIPHFG